MTPPREDAAADAPDRRRRRDLERQQTILLAKAFFARLFESDLMPAGLPQVRLVISTIAGLTIPLTIVPVLMRLHSSRLVAFQYTISMTALAFIALVVWEGIFPDRRDARILSSLPIRTRTFVLARLGALAALFGILAAGSAALPAFAFTVIGNPIAHFAGMIALDAFAFFAIVALQCMLLNVVGRAAAQRLAILLQVVIIVVVLQVPLVPSDPRLPATIDATTAWWLPSLWFVGLFQLLSGDTSVAMRGPAALAAASAVGLPLLTALLYAATYRRLTRRAVEGDAAASAQSLFTVARAAARRLLVLFVPNAVARAVCLFTLQTIARSRRHKMLLAMYVGVAVALILSVLVPRAVQRGLAGFAMPDAALLSCPLVLMFLTLVGFRSLIRIPVEIKANWIFRLGEPVQRAAVAGGVAYAMIVGGVLPITSLAFGAAWLLWGTSIAVQHALFCGALGVLLAHALLVRFDKVPFTCTYFPGSSRLRVLWPFYVTLFCAYSFTTARYEARLFRRGDDVLAAVLAISAAAGAFVVVRRLRLHESTGLRFEEHDPEALFAGFRLSESLAAERTHRRT